MLAISHLNEVAREALERPDEERIHRINSARWIGYTRAAQILARLDDLLKFPKKHRMPNLLIVGATNNGKTMIVNRFESRHKPFDDPEDFGGVEIPVIVVQAPNVPDEGKFYDEILMRLFAPFKFNEKVSKKHYQAVHILQRVKARILIIDEIHNIIAGSHSRQRQFLNIVKNFGNELQIPIVGVGTREAFNALQTDPQLSNRFEPMPLPRWKMGEEYLRLLVSFEQALPLKNPSQLIETNLALKVLSMSEGVIGEISTILSRAAIVAIKNKQERITLKTLDAIDWVQPSKRKLQDI